MGVSSRSCPIWVIVSRLHALSSYFAGCTLSVSWLVTLPSSSSRSHRSGNGVLPYSGYVLREKSHDLSTLCGNMELYHPFTGCVSSCQHITRLHAIEVRVSLSDQTEVVAHLHPELSILRCKQHRSPTKASPNPKSRCVNTLDDSIEQTDYSSGELKVERLCV